MVSVAEVARDLDVSRATVYQLIETGRLPAVQMAGPGSRWLIPRAPYERWLQRVEADAEQQVSA